MPHGRNNQQPAAAKRAVKKNNCCPMRHKAESSTKDGARFRIENSNAATKATNVAPGAVRRF